MLKFLNFFASTRLALNSKDVAINCSEVHTAHILLI